MRSRVRSILCIPPSSGLELSSGTFGDVLLQIHKPDIFFFFPPSLFFPQIFLQPRTAPHRRHRQTVSIYAQSVGPNLPKQVISCAFLYPHKHKRYLKMHTRVHAQAHFCIVVYSLLHWAWPPEQPQQPLVGTSSWWLCGCWSRQHW